MPSGSLWAFYGRRTELEQLNQILARKRWFFLQIAGRRRIGKTSLIQQALAKAGVDDKTLYIQIPDSDPAGVVAACNGYLETCGLPDRLKSLDELPKLIGRLASAGYVVALDEFQYFHRKQLSDFCSWLQAEVDRLSARAANVPGGLIVLGSLHTEMTALLEDRDAPLFNRTTDSLELDHLDISSILEILRAHADTQPTRLLFLWNLFEGVPKFYRDAYEQGALNLDRRDLLVKMFFASSAPLRNEADNWFLRELRGRYDMVLQYIASHPGCINAEIVAALVSVSATDDEQQVGGYLKILSERYRMIERRLPIFAPPRARLGRYYIRDNFLRAWLAALQRPVSAIAFRPLDTLVQQADERLAVVEGHALEDLAARLYAERSRRQIGDFAVTEQISGYWDRGDVEIDLVAVNGDERRIRFGTCKRSQARLVSEAITLQANAARFLDAHRKYSDWTKEYVGIAPDIDDETRQALSERGLTSQSLGDLVEGL